MGAKENLLADFICGDSSGGIERIHNSLIAAGLKYKGPANSKTLLYYFRRNGHEVGVVAMRDSPPLLSFPSAFWSGRPNLRVALNRGASHFIEPEGLVSQSQYSAGQLRITTTSIETLLLIAREIIIPEACAASTTA